MANKKGPRSGSPWSAVGRAILHARGKPRSPVQDTVVAVATIAVAAMMAMVAVVLADAHGLEPNAFYDQTQASCPAVSHRYAVDAGPAALPLSRARTASYRRRRDAGKQKGPMIREPLAACVRAILDARGKPRSAVGGYHPTSL